MAFKYIKKLTKLFPPDITEQKKTNGTRNREKMSK